MARRRSFLERIGRAAPLGAVVLTLVLAGAEIAQAQYYYYGPPRPPAPVQQRGGGGFFGFFEPYRRILPPSMRQQQEAPREERPADYSRAPAPKKQDTVPERNVVVLGDAMADWLAYGLEDAFAEQPDIGVIRKHRTVSGLIRYQPRGAPEDWVAAAHDILANEKPNAVLIMLGLNDRQSIREAAPNPKAKSDSKNDNKTDAAGQQKQDGQAQPAEAAQVPDDEQEETPAVAAPERNARTAAGGTHEFRSEKWIELYKKKIADMIAVARTKGVPVLWVGLPAIRGQRSTQDVLLLNSLFREEASKAGITYVDVWDGFVDERGTFLNSGPDLEGQTRRLRSADGVYFTRAGARKLAHFAERELTRLFQNRGMPMALPSEPGTPDVAARPGLPAPRPLAGPIVPLNASSVGTSELLGGAGSRPANVDAIAARILVKGEPLPPPPGRADDFAWPRREVGAPDNLALTESAPPASTIAPTASLAPAEGSSAASEAGAAAPQRARAQPASASTGSAATQQKQPPRRANADNVPRPPMGIGPSAQQQRRGFFPFFW